MRSGWSATGISTTRRPTGPARPRPDAEHVEEFRRALDEAVRLRLRADVPVGCYLSGGLDSCAVLGLAARHRSDPIRAFTLSFDRPEYDETAIAREMAELANAEFHPIPITQTELADHFAEAVAHAETLAINAHGVAKYLLSRAVRDAGYKVVLTGEGSDEILAGYPHFRRDLWLYDHGAGGGDAGAVEALLGQLEVRNLVSRGLLLPDGEGASLEGLRAALGFAPSWLETGATQAHKLRALFSPDFDAEFAGRDAYRELLEGLDVPGQLAGRAPLNQSLYLWAKGDAAELCVDVPGRPHGDGALHRGSAAVPGPPRRRSWPATCRLTRRSAERSRNTCCARPPVRSCRRPCTPGKSTRSRLPRLPWTPTAGSTSSSRTRCAGRPWTSLPFFDRSRVVALLDQLPDHGRRPPDRLRHAADGPAEHLRDPGTDRFTGLRSWRLPPSDSCALRQSGGFSIQDSRFPMGVLPDPTKKKASQTTQSPQASQSPLFQPLISFSSHIDRTGPTGENHGGLRRNGPVWPRNRSLIRGTR